MHVGTYDKDEETGRGGGAWDGTSNSGSLSGFSLKEDRGNSVATRCRGGCYHIMSYHICSVLTSTRTCANVYVIS